ncbi:MAG: hypothetical protein A2V64_00795 [Bacteroidetes bacterium RBG_13_43_22]|nr:MAG: hypothetical protein A2V64_00795 [Bacteroidetes bacterium RBG_13_43_22]
MRKLINLSITLFLITIVLFSQTPNTLTQKEKNEGWILLFDGVSTNGWTTTRGQPVPPGGWEVINGCINTVIRDKGGDIITENEYSDFELSVDFNITPGCNSGVKYFFTTYENGGNLGCEYQILDDILGEDKKQANHLCGSFYDVLPPDESKKKVNPPGEWNTLGVVAKGKSVEHWLNGVKILEFIRGDKVYTDAVALSKFSKTVPAFGMVEKGHVLLQYHGGLVSFRNIKIKII